MMKKSLIVLAASLMTCSFQMKAETAQQILNKFYNKQYNKEQAIEALEKIGIKKIPTNLYSPLKQAGLMNKNNTFVSNSSNPSTGGSTGLTTSNKSGMKTDKADNAEINKAIEDVKKSAIAVIKTSIDTGHPEVKDQLETAWEEASQDTKGYRGKK